MSCDNFWDRKGLRGTEVYPLSNQLLPGLNSHGYRADIAMGLYI